MSYDPYQPGQPRRRAVPPPPHPPQKPKRKGLRIFLGISGAIVALFIVAAVAGSHVKTPAPVSTPAATASAGAASTVAAAAKPSPSAPHVLLSFAGSGIKNSAPFLVPGQVTVKYTYDCAAFGQSGNFAADLLYGNQASLSSDDQQVANELGTGGTQSTVIYPQDPGHDYYLSVNSECSWSVTVTGS